MKQAILFMLCVFLSRFMFAQTTNKQTQALLTAQIAQLKQGKDIN